MPQTAFITGAASGIGFATAEKLYHQGWIIGLADIDEYALSESTSDWDPARVSRWQLDVTDADRVEQVIGEFAMQWGGQLDVLFNSAGILRIDRFEDIPARHHQQIMNVNVMGVIHCCQSAFPYLKNSPGSTVINMSSASATYGIPHMASYSASKFAVSGLTEALQLEWEDYDIRVCDVMPPFVSTPMLNNQESGAPVLDRLGVNLNAGDVANSVLEQIHDPKTHRPVSLMFSLMWMLNQITPRFVSRAMVRFLNRSPAEETAQDAEW
ncbi:MAG: short-chain dehydrogenase [Oceanospirillaceae bacterium]|nr:short-chain dehydrogenase [Oceanospirillaceae bacterium]MBT10574.1 short-chain dehydrogenase [Oceanospirillaceae bacterium]|tara:strand:+ start:107377 stop:108180 length:804 start_codon:yes stop_codon:yes gene_type:complete